MSRRARPDATPLEQLHAKAKRMKPSEELTWQITASGIPVPEFEYRFHPDRKWRFDFAWPFLPSNVMVDKRRLAVELDGGGFIQGRHSRGIGIEKDCEKYAEAMLLGWRILRVTPRQVKSGQALNWILELLK